MTITLSTPMLKLINDLLATGPWGTTRQEVVRRLVECQLRAIQREGKQ